METLSRFLRWLPRPSALFAIVAALSLAGAAIDAFAWSIVSQAASVEAGEAVAYNDQLQAQIEARPDDDSPARKLMEGVVILKATKAKADRTLASSYGMNLVFLGGVFALACVGAWSYRATPAVRPK